MATLSYWIVVTVPTAWVLPSRPCRHVGVSTQLMGSTSTKHRLTPLSGDRGFHPTHSIVTRPNEPHGCWHTPRRHLKIQTRGTTPVERDPTRWGTKRTDPSTVRCDGDAPPCIVRVGCRHTLGSVCLRVLPDEENATLYRLVP